MTSSICHGINLAEFSTRALILHSEGRADPKKSIKGLTEKAVQVHLGLNRFAGLL